MRSRMRGLVRPGALGRYGLWRMARWGDEHDEHDRQNGLWVMWALCFRARLLYCCLVFVCRTCCKGTLGQVCFRGSRRTGLVMFASCFSLWPVDVSCHTYGIVCTSVTRGFGFRDLGQSWVGTGELLFDNVQHDHLHWAHVTSKGVSRVWLNTSITKDVFVLSCFLWYVHGAPVSWWSGTRWKPYVCLMLGPYFGILGKQFGVLHVSRCFEPACCHLHGPMVEHDRVYKGFGPRTGHGSQGVGGPPDATPNTDGGHPDIPYRLFSALHLYGHMFRACFTSWCFDRVPWIVLGSVCSARCHWFVESGAADAWASCGIQGTWGPPSSCGHCIHGPQYGIPGRQFSILQFCCQHGPHLGILKRQFSTLQLYGHLGCASVMPRCVDMVSWTGLGFGCSASSRGLWAAGASDVWASYGIQGIIQCLSEV